MNEILEQKIEKRQEYNIKILDILAEQVERYPHLRFGQILINTNTLLYSDKDELGEYLDLYVQDPFNEESFETYERIMKTQCGEHCQSECEQEK